MRNWRGGEWDGKRTSWGMALVFLLAPRESAAEVVFEVMFVVGLVELGMLSGWPISKPCLGISLEKSVGIFFGDVGFVEMLILLSI